MGAPYAADLPEDDPYAVAGPGPGAGPGIVAPPPTIAAPTTDPTVMTPVGQIPISQLPGAAAGGPPSPPVDAVSGGPPVPPSEMPPPGAPDVTPLPQPTGAPAEAPTLAAGAMPPRPVRPPLTGDPQKDIKSSLEYEQALDDWHNNAVAAAASGGSDIRKKQANDELAAAQAEQKRRDDLRQQQEQERAAAKKDIIDREVQARAAQNDLETGKWRGDQSAGAKIASFIEMAVGGIGAGLSAAGGHPTGNLAAQAIDEKMDREHKAAVDRVNAANESLLQARYGYKDAEENRRAALNDVDADFAAKHHLIAAEAEAALRNRGVSPDQIAQTDIVAGNLAKSEQHKQDILAREIEAGRKAELEGSTLELNKSKIAENEALARMHDRQHGKGAGTGGGAGGADVQGLAQAIRVGVDDGKGGKRPLTYDEQLAAAKKFGVPAEAKAGHVSLTSVLKGAAFDANEARKNQKAPGGVDATKIVRDLTGKPLGLAPSGRGGAAAIQSDMRTNMTALTQLKELRHDPGFLSGGPKFHDAVLALAATTTAGKTDTTTGHEKGSITNIVGMPDPDAIDRKIAQLQARVDAVRNQLAPLPAGYTEARAAGGTPPKTQDIGGATYEFTGGKWKKQVK